ncbi:DUF4334 domain-containing protein [Acinetobacter ursingii]|uniref:DUF4334 domain-containing protein n=1 Tax=Acinetobacter ursingii TaxID=108980 RepID=UPI0019572E76|nr:DUF4334 domain-containing protein [Acinetobacter ursingii]MCH2016856.1 DUF4334 domain-containing protein [Acinetobacter ursingii]MCU4589952.1 DUF4334 domain-containing protein [Acinetobacter ursingii]VTX65611.1 Uncharacterised protein [Acinetobacter ursingii]
MSFKKRFDELKAKNTFEDDSELLSFYDELPPVEVKEILSPWKGGDFNTGHWCSESLLSSRWFGKWYKSKMDAIPLLCFNDQNKLYSNKSSGEASLWEIEFRGKVSATMVYDSAPIFDHFRKVDENTLMGIMNGKSIPGRPDVIQNGKYFYFYLERLDRLPAEFIKEV